MIFYWLSLVFRKFTWLFKPPAKRDVARIDPNRPCPVCGGRQGVIRCVHRGIKNEKKVLVQMTCGICGARTYGEPVVAITPQLAWPATPRTPIEREEEDQVSLAARIKLAELNQGPILNAKQ